MLTTTACFWFSSNINHEIFRLLRKEKETKKKLLAIWCDEPTCCLRQLIDGLSPFLVNLIPLVVWRQVFFSACKLYFRVENLSLFLNKHFLVIAGPH